MASNALLVNYNVKKEQHRSSLPYMLAAYEPKVYMSSGYSIRTFFLDFFIQENYVVCDLLIVCSTNPFIYNI